jgi:hypothetical protein
MRRTACSSRSAPRAGRPCGDICAWPRHGRPWPTNRIGWMARFPRCNTERGRLHDGSASRCSGALDRVCRRINHSGADHDQAGKNGKLIDSASRYEDLGRSSESRPIVSGVIARRTSASMPYRRSDKSPAASWRKSPRSAPTGKSLVRRKTSATCSSGGDGCGCMSGSPTQSQHAAQPRWWSSIADMSAS